MKSVGLSVLAVCVLSIASVIGGPIAMAASEPETETKTDAEAETETGALVDADDPMEFLAENLELSPEQAEQLGASLGSFAATLDQLKTDQEKEGADSDALIAGAKKAQEEHLHTVQGVLTQEQFAKYEAIKEEAFRSAFRDLAEIQLFDMQPEVGFSDEQREQLAPVLGDALYEVISIAWDNAGKKLRPGQKVKLGNQMKKIQSNTNAAVAEILTPEQLELWNLAKEGDQQEGE